MTGKKEGADRSPLYELNLLHRKGHHGVIPVIYGRRKWRLSSPGQSRNGASAGM